MRVCSAARHGLAALMMLALGGPGAPPPTRAGDDAPSLRPGKAADPGLKDGDLDTLRALLKKAVEDKTLPGCSLLLAHKGEVIFKEAFGTFTVDQPVRIASDTKPWAMTAVMVQVDRGTLELDDPITKYLPEFQGTKVEKATVRQVMSHTAGILPSISPGASLPGTLADAIRERVAKNGKLTDPGTFHYGGTSMDTAARIAEVAGKMPFEEQMRKHVWEPLGLKNTHFASAGDAKSVSPEAAARGEGRYVACGGGLSSTLDDMAAFYQMHLNGGAYGDKRILSTKTIAAMHTKQRGATNPRMSDGAWGPDYGLGFYLSRPDRDGRHQTFHHGGALGTLGWADVDRQLVGVFFSQAGLNRARPVIVAVQQKVRELVPAAGAKPAGADKQAGPDQPKKPARPGADAEALFQKIAGGKDKVSKEQFLKAAPEHVAGGRLKERTASFGRLFDRLDANKDGFLTAEEFSKFTGLRDLLGGQVRPDRKESPAPPPKAEPTKPVPASWRARVEQVVLILDSFSEIEQQVPALKGRLDAEHIGITGYSLGAYIAQVAAGATVDWPNEPRGQSLADRRVKALVQISGKGSGQQGLTKESWKDLKLPMLTVTGTRDRGATGGDHTWKREPFDLSPPGDKYHVLIEGAGHGSFSPRAAQAGGEAKAVFDDVLIATTAFWDAHLKGEPVARAYLSSDALPAFSEARVKLDRR